MSLKAEIAGLPNVSKSTIFNALTKSNIAAGPKEVRTWTVKKKTKAPQRG